MGLKGRERRKVKLRPSIVVDRPNVVSTRKSPGSIIRTYHTRIRSDAITQELRPGQGNVPARETLKRDGFKGWPGVDDIDVCMHIFTRAWEYRLTRFKAHIAGVLLIPCPCLYRGRSD